MFKYLFSILWIFFLPVLLAAQVSNTGYGLSFNPVTNLYDVYLHINEGSATKAKDRVQFNAQLTLLVPEGSEVEIVKCYMPLQGNQLYNGTKPMQWNKANVIKKPASDPFHDYISIAPQLSPVSFYNDLNAGDKIKLFSLQISHVANCGNDVRLFNNSVDLVSTDIGMAGGDFSNGFTLGNTTQKYTSNEVMVTPAIDIVKDIVVRSKKGIFIEANSTEENQFGPYTYEWRTPLNMIKKGRSFNIENPSTNEYGTYQLIVKDARGCMQIKTVDVRSDASIPVSELVFGEKNQLNTPSMENKESSHAPINDHVTVYPNPSFGEFFVNLHTEVGADIELQLTDESGRNVLKNIVSTKAYETSLNIHVPTDNLQSGAYRLLARINGNNYDHKVIIVK